MSQFFLRGVWSAAVVGICLHSVTATAAPGKIIRLRSQPIPTRFSPDLGRAKGLAASPTVSGLYLVQTTGPLTAEQRVQLAALGVDLIRYVPDDSFIARFRAARPDTVRSLPFVGWIGEYRTEHKMTLETAKAATASLANQNLSVSIVLAPRASEGEIAGARQLLASVEQQSNLRSATILRGKISGANLQTLARSGAVLWIEPVRPMKLFDEVSSKIVAGDGGTQQLLTQLLGYDGAGVKVAVADSGLNNGDAASMHPDLLGRTPAFFYYGSLTDAADEHSHGTHVAGIVAGNGATGGVDARGTLYGLGVAPGASIIAQRLFDGVGNFEAPAGGFAQLTRDAKSAGADIGSNSWGDDTQGRYDVSAMEFDELVRDADSTTFGDQQYILEFSAGNAGPGPQTIGSPAVAKNVIATGASQNDRPDFLIYDEGPEAMADFSSRGPCEDGRIKPDVVAPGTWIASLQSSSATDQFAWSAIDSFYQYQGGTSQAGPHASGAAAVFVHYYRRTYANATPSPALVKAALINCALDMFDDFGTDPTPNMDEGWGLIDLTAFFDPVLSFNFTDQNTPLTNGQIFEKRVFIGSADEPLKITLAYSDVPGFPGALSALVNDLNLEVVAPGGTVYRGNQFNSGESVPNSAGTDSINNVEGVFLSSPVAGEYIVRVKGQHVVDDARSDTPAIDQDFALVISGQMPAPGVGTIVLDRPAYRAPSQIRVTLIDTDLAGAPNAQILLRSTTEFAGENLTLNASGPSGVFTGQIATAVSPAIGALQIANNDLIEARYFDASSASTRTATAVGDFVAPSITGVLTTNEFGKILVEWQTSEPATSIVRYNTNSTLSRAATNVALTITHSLALLNLVPGQTNYFAVTSADAAGNAATNNNGGLLFSFVVPASKTALLVDAFLDNGFDNIIPLSVYTDALTQAGITYDVWNPAVVGRSPSTNDLRPYRAAIWRFNDGVFSADTLSAPEQNSIRAYLNEGGAFFMSSMEQLTRLGNGFFRNNVLHVSSFGEDFGVPDVNGVLGESITAGMAVDLHYEQYSNIWHDFIGVPDDISDTMVLAPEATPILFDSFGEAAGVKFPRTGQDGGRVVYLSFPLDAVPAAGPAPNNRATLFRNIFSFLVPGFNGRGTVSLDSPAYNIPSFANVEVGDSDLAGQPSTTVIFYSTTQSSGVPVTLTPASIPGLFRGSIQLIAHTNPVTAGKLRVQNGDSIWVDYFDVSSNAIVRATSVIDTDVPGISGVLATPDYEEATVTWTTDEPSDSVVQFGESPFLGRAASDPVLDDDHEVALRGLLPDKTYYFQVLSRDAAGNVRIDDNNGQLYTFKTLKPIIPPWFDNLNGNPTNWAFFDGDGSQSAWTLGSPTNDLGTNNAFSPPKCFGSVLHGAALDYTENFLISPAIYLTNGNVATLNFWHNYDFTERSFDDIIEGGQLLIITNNAAAPIVLADFSDLSGDWIEEEFVLTPYVGHVVYFVWYYYLFSLDTVPRAGWLVDDVSVTVGTVQPGTVAISNNIWQASFNLNGPLVLNDKGRSEVITSAPPGTYSIIYTNVPYYTTPSAQTNTLVSGGTINFTGNYAAADSNSNGIPDPWEVQHFGSVSPGRTQFTDTDGDGQSDYGEFVAGTNPNNPSQNFKVNAQQLPNGTVSVVWTSSIGRAYQIRRSTNNGVTWTPFSGWIQATSGTTSFGVPASPPGTAQLFRVEVQP